jgi:hypothetical protein
VNLLNLADGAAIRPAIQDFPSGSLPEFISEQENPDAETLKLLLACTA